jgi:OOP family OmpA-OmpF porin
MMRTRNIALTSFLVAVGMATVSSSVEAQDMLPADNGLATYHTMPRYRESESHPFRVLAYVVHPVGWLAREVLFRPLSYFASSTETTRSVMGYREPFDYRQPECFSADDSTPDCRSLSPFNYDNAAPVAPVEAAPAAVVQATPQVYFPNVGFDFDKRTLNDLGKGRVHEIARTLQSSSAVKVVLQGHTDYVGTDAYNEKLGLDRAEAVRSELVALGVSADRLSTVTFGESQPIFSEQEDWARAVNRRVEVQVGEATSAPAN